MLHANTNMIQATWGTAVFLILGLIVFCGIIPLQFSPFVTYFFINKG